MTAEIILLGSRTVSEERLYADLMAAYDVHRTLRTTASFENAARALKIFRMMQDEILSQDPVQQASRAGPAWRWVSR